MVTLIICGVVALQTVTSTEQSIAVRKKQILPFMYRATSGKLFSFFCFIALLSYINI